MLTVLLTAAALAAPWVHEPTDARIGFNPDWTVTQGGSMVSGQLAQAVHVPTGGGLIVRAQPTSAILDLPERVLNRVGDVEAGMSADRYAMVVALSQEDEALILNTRYLGFSDVAGARVGRWVFFTDATDTEPGRMWWHTTWRTSSHFLEIISWVPDDRSRPFMAAMRTLEGNVGPAGAWQPGAALLYRKPVGKCDGPASVDRMAAVARSKQYAVAKAALRVPSAHPNTSAIVELGILGAFIADADACVQEMASSVGACSVHERRSDTQRSKEMQQAVVRCLETAERSSLAVEALLGSTEP